MNKQSTNSKTFWGNDLVLETSIERKQIEYMVNKRKNENNTFLKKLTKLLKDIF
jgi:hypothetical protein